MVGKENNEGEGQDGSNRKETRIGERGNGKKEEKKGGGMIGWE